MQSTFYFKQFKIIQSNEVMKVGTDGVLLGAWVLVRSSFRNVLDIGTGTGIIALMLAQRSSSLVVDAVEQSRAGFDLASLNFTASPWGSRLTAHHNTIQNYALSTNKQYDCIVSNPPFFTQGTPSGNTAKSQMRHTILLPFEDLLKSVQKLLSSNGIFSVILPYKEGLEFKELALSYGLYCTCQTNVFPKIGKEVERLLLSFEKKERDVVEKRLTIETPQRHVYTEDYISLTKDFYLKM